MKYFILAVFALFKLISFGQNWIQKADFPGIGRHRLTGITIGNKGYVGLGHMNGTGVNIIYKDWWQFDPASNSWSQKADYVTLCYAAIAWGNSTNGYIGGGTAFTNEYFKYSPADNTWTPIALCPVNANDQTAFCINEKGYVLDNGSLLEYDPSNDSWQYKTSSPDAFNIWQSSFVIGNSAFVKNVNQLWEYKQATDQWISRADFPGLATGGSSAFTVDNLGYIVSGYFLGLGDLTREVWAFNPGDNSWTSLGEFDGAGRRFSIGMSIQNRGYFGVGTNGINFNDWWAFDHFTADVKPSLNQQVILYPNPSADKIYLSEMESFPENISFTISNVEGKVVFKGSKNDFSSGLSINDLPSGNYKIVGKEGNDVRIFKSFVKQ